MKTKVKTEKNPLLYQSHKQNTLDEARNMFMKYLNEFARNKNLSEEDTTLIKEFFEEVYLEKKASYILEDKLKELNLYLNQAFFYAVSGSYKKQTLTENFPKVFYYRNKKRELSYERH